MRLTSAGRPALVRQSVKMVQRRRLAALVAAVACLGAFGGASSSDAVTGADPNAVTVVQTSADLSEHLALQPALELSATAPAKGVPVIAVNDGVGYQQVNGFGAAMTDSSAWLIERRLSAGARAGLMNGLFGPGGIRLNFLRLPIGASDFSAGAQPYSYDDLPPGQTDPRLARFSTAHDQGYVLPALTQARSLNRQIQFLASPWTPPAWMKGNASLNNVNDGGTLLGSAYGPWAAYIVKFIQAYARAGVPITALTPQNEPGAATLYPGLNMSPPSLAIWIKQDLEPALARARLHPQLYGDDSGWGSPQLAQATVSGASASALSGVAWHCYFGSPYVMSALHASRPKLTEIVDECSPGISALPTSEVVIASLRNWASTVALWNLALNPTGGPVQGHDSGCKGCSGLATIDPHHGTVALNKPLYQLGQASAYVARGARRIDSNHFVTYRYTRPGVNFVTAGLDDVAFVNPDGTHVLIVYNNASRAISFAVDWHGQYVDYTVPAGAMTTFLWNRHNS
jgi:glucosylceramidase